MSIEKNIEALNIRITELETELRETNSHLQQMGKIEKDLLESGFRFKSLTQNSPIGILFIDINGNILEANQSFIDLLGSTNLEETKKINLLEYSPFIEYGIAQDFIICLKEQKTMTFERWFVSLNSRKIYLNYHLSPIFNPNQELIGILANIQNLTRRKLTETALEDSQHLFRSVLSAVPDIMIVLTREGIYKEVFTASSELLAAPAEELIGTSIYKFVSKEVGSSMIRIIQKVLDQNKLQIYDYPITINERTLWFQANVVPLRMDNEANVLWIARDITERKEVIKHLKIAKQKAEESDKLKTAFLANMSHEIRTPLNGILGLAELLKDDEIDQNEKKDYIDIINTRSGDLLKIINDIIDISKIEANQINIEPSALNINTLLHYLENSFISKLKQNQKSNIQIILNYGLNDDKAFILADELRLQQILNNLMENAMKYTHEGHIEIGYNIIDAKEIHFFIKDTGIGIPKDKQDLVFDSFRKADESYARLFGGTGLGLSISKKLVELMSGKIWVESEKNIGSSFHFFIPYYPTEITKTTDNRSNNKQFKYNWNNKTILIVEDDITSYLLFETILEKSNITIIHASNGLDAIETCKSNPKIDLILMDIQLPELDGYQTTMEIRKFLIDIPIIAQTAHALKEDKIKSMDAGCNDYITKPIDFKLLLPIIDEYLRD